MVRTIKHHIWKLHPPVQPSGHQPSRFGHSKPYYDNYVQPKCNRPDARATPFGHGLVMEAFSAILERRLQLTVRTLSQAVRTPSSILIITFWSNIGLGRNQCHWKANKKWYNLMVWKTNRIVRTAPVQTEISSVRTTLPKFENFSELLFGHGNSCLSRRPRLPFGHACQRLWFWPDLGLLKPINKRL
jgi:hypothetical protein